jgi:hypothetical protein
MNSIIVSIGEIVYLIYMFYYFKTKVDFNQITPGPELVDSFFNIIEERKTKISKSILENRKIYLNHYDGEKVKICLFGRYVIVLLFIFLIVRHFIELPKYITKIVLAITLLLSLININALVYLLPIFFIELYSLTF